MNKLLFLKLLIGLIALSGCSGNNQPENPVRFEPVASMPTDGRASAVAFAVDGKGYVLGGRSGVRSGILSDFWMYNPETDEWMELPKPPAEFKPRVNAVAQVVDGKAYIGLGYNGGGIYNEKSYSSDWWMYDPQTGEWTRKADYPTHYTTGVSAFVCGKDIMVCFGFYDYATENVYAYNVQTDSWREIDVAGVTAMEETIAGVVSGRYFAGLCARWFEYLPESETWERRASYPNAKSRICAAQITVNDRFFMLGGRVAWQNIKVYDEVCEYVPSQDKWHFRGYLPGGGRENMVSFVIDGIGYVGLGETETDGRRNDFYKLIIP